MFGQHPQSAQNDNLDPWKRLANAIVTLAAEDYRDYMRLKLSRGLSMSEMEMTYLNSKILDVKIFFESDWGYMCSRGLSPVIWEKLQAEFAEELARFELCYPYAVRHRAKLARRRKKAEARWLKNKLRHQRQRLQKKYKNKEECSDV